MNRNKLLSLSFLILSFQCNSSAYLPESISTLYFLIKDHVVGPLDFRQQGNAFIEGAIHEVFNQVANKAYEVDENNRMVKTTRNNLISYIALPIIIGLPLTSVSLKIYNRKSACLLARAIGIFVGYKLIERLVDQK